eukprot:10324005-Lingulodinium_polyedra.AAC.1
MPAAVQGSAGLDDPKLPTRANPSGLPVRAADAGADGRRCEMPGLCMGGAPQWWIAGQPPCRCAPTGGGRQ